MSAAVVLEETWVRDLVITEIHSDAEAHLTQAMELGPNGMTLRRSPARTRVGKHLWLEFAINGRSMRVLGEVVGRSPQITRIEFKHFWPRDRATYMHYLSIAHAA